MAEPGVHEQSAAYALHALAEDEARVFEEHLRTCTVCMAELDSLQEAAAALAYAADQRVPAPDLRARLLKQVQVRSHRTPAGLRRGRWTIAVALSTAAAAIVLGAWAFSLHESLARERAARAAEARIAAVLSSPGARRYPLIGAHGTLAVAPDGGAVLAVSSLSEAPRGKSYEAWVVARGVPQPAGVFSGGGAMTIALTRPVLRGARVAVSLERAGGVPRLTGTLLFGAQTA